MNSDQTTTQYKFITVLMFLICVVLQALFFSLVVFFKFFIAFCLLLPVDFIFFRHIF